MITNQIEKGNLKIVYCNTDNMVANFMTKGLNGTKFNKFCKDIMGITRLP